MNSMKGSLNTDETMRIGVVTSRFNLEITEKLEKGAVDFLLAQGLSETQIIRVSVPGAIEIPLAVQSLMRAGCDGVVALGAVIRGETTHYDYVCSSVERGCSHLQLKHRKPVAFGVLTTENEAQALARAGGNMGNKGAESAEVVLEMINVLKLIKSTKTTQR